MRTTIRKGNWVQPGSALDRDLGQSQKTRFSRSEWVHHPALCERRLYVESHKPRWFGIERVDACPIEAKPGAPHRMGSNSDPLRCLNNSGFAHARELVGKSPAVELRVVCGVARSGKRPALPWTLRLGSRLENPLAHRQIIGRQVYWLNECTAVGLPAQTIASAGYGDLPSGFFTHRPSINSASFPSR